MHCGVNRVLGIGERQGEPTATGGEHATAMAGERGELHLVMAREGRLAAAQRSAVTPPAACDA